MAEDTALITLATPTRFLMENGEWNLTPNELNPFDYPLKQIEKSLSPQSSVCQSPTSSNDSYFVENVLIQKVAQKPVKIDREYIPQPKKVSKSTGRKRRIVFEGEDAEERRKQFLERNRIAAYKCRQRKKSWLQALEKNAEIQNTRNEQLRALVAQLREESMYLRNLLLSHGNCDCESIQAYFHKTSMAISNNTPMLDSTTSLTMATPFSTGLTPYLNPGKSTDYFASTHSKT